jgi:DNA-binding NarL/FixJ family response regulator
MKKTVVIVDDHMLIAKAISNIVNDFLEFKVLYEVEHGKALIEKIKKDKENIPDIVLLDVSMPEMDGFETAAWLKEEHPEILVMALSMQDDEMSLVKMVQNGAKGYMHKNSHPVDLENALMLLYKEKIYFPSWATNKILQNMNTAKAETKPKLGIPINEREKEFLAYVCLDLTYKEIGDRMCCSPRTVEGYRDNLFEKLEIRSRVGLALYAVRNGFYKI